MVGIYIGSTAGYSGKNMLAMSLGLRLQKEGYKVGYMKPVGAMPTEIDGKPGDEDALFVQEVLGLSKDPEKVTPVVVNQDFKAKAFKGEYNNLMDKIPDNVEARVNIREGVPISQDMFIPHYTIKIGDRFLLHSGNKRIQLEVSVEAVENGNIGDIIKVKNLSSGRVVKGLIKSEDNVCSVTE